MGISENRDNTWKIELEMTIYSFKLLTNVTPGVCFLAKCFAAIARHSLFIYVPANGWRYRHCIQAKKLYENQLVSPFNSVRPNPLESTYEGEHVLQAYQD